MLRGTSSRVGRGIFVAALALSAYASSAAALEESVTKLCAPAWKAVDPDGDTFADSALSEAGLAAARQCEAAGHPLGAVSVANMLGRLGRNREAAEAIERALASGRELAAAYRERCLLEFEKGAQGWAPAMAACDEATRLEPNWHLPYLTRGFMYYSTQRYPEAEREWRAALARESRSAPVYQNLGLALGAQNRHAEALEQHLEARRIAPRFSGPRINVAKSLEALGRQAEALEEFTAAARDIESADTLLELGAYHERRRQPVEAGVTYGRLLARDPNNVAALRARGRLSEAAGSFDSARRDYARVRELEPKSLEAALDELRAIARGPSAAAEDFDVALERARRLANEIGTPDAVKQYRKGQLRIARENQNWEGLEQIANQYIQQFPDDAFGYTQRSLARRNQGKYRGVVEDETRLLAMTPDQAESLFLRGKAYLDLGEWAAAEADFSRLLALRPKYLWAWNSRGHARAELGRMAEAYRDFEQFLSLYDGRPNMNWVHWAIAGGESGVSLKTLRQVFDARAPEPQNKDLAALTTSMLLDEATSSGEIRDVLRRIESGNYFND